MSKDKKTVQKAVEKALEKVLREMEHKCPPDLSAGANELLEEDMFRKEAYGMLQSWVEDRLKVELEALNQKADGFIDEVNNFMKKQEKHLDKMEYDIKQIKKDGKTIENAVMELEKSDEDERQILTQIAVGAGIATPGASFKEVRKGYKRWVKKRYYSRIPDNNRRLEEKNVFDM